MTDAAAFNPYDVERFRRVMDQVTDENLNMSVWVFARSCGTVACLAGHVLLDAGEELRFEVDLGISDGVEAVQTAEGEFIATRAVELLAPDLPEDSDDPRHIPVLDARDTLRDLFMVQSSTKDELWKDVERYTKGMVTRS